MKIFDQTFSMIERAMDLRLRRHGVVSSNVANAETPNYRARELDFGGELQRMLKDGKAAELAKTDTRHMDVNGSMHSHVTFDDSGAVGSNGNNVDMDITLGKLADNARKYTAATNYLNMKLRLIRFAARGGRGGM